MYKPLALAFAGVMFLLYPALRPWHDESTVDGALTSMGSGAWVAAHFFAMIGFILVPVGLLALRSKVPAILAWIGAGLVLPYYGAEDFGLHAIARHGGDVLELAEAVRYQPLAITMFGLGLLSLGVAGVWAAVTVWRDGVLPRYSGIAFGLGLALFLPQFFAPAAVRIGHGVLLAVGSIWLAVALWRRAKAQPAA